jgi:hypothetical protein
MITRYNPRTQCVKRHQGPRILPQVPNVQVIPEFVNLAVARRQRWAGQPAACIVLHHELCQRLSKPGRIGPRIHMPITSTAFCIAVFRMYTLTSNASAHILSTITAWPSTQDLRSTSHGQTRRCSASPAALSSTAQQLVAGTAQPNVSTPRATATKLAHH